VTDRRRLEQELEQVRRDGYSMCFGELEETLYGASAAVLNERRRPVAIVSVWGPQHRVPAGRLPEVGGKALAAAQQIEALLA
jgi:DNA-binding IclR family transcriptional regulator